MATKYCSRCQTVKATNKFDKNPQHKDGLQTFCSECCYLLSSYFKEKRTIKPNKSKLRLIINWRELEKCYIIFFVDIHNKTILEMNIIFVNDSHVILQSSDLLYSVNLLKNEWLEGDVALFTY